MPAAVAAYIPVMVHMEGLSVHHLANPKSHSFTRGGSLSSRRVLSIFKSLHST